LRFASGGPFEENNQQKGGAKRFLQSAIRNPNFFDLKEYIMQITKELSQKCYDIAYADLSPEVIDRAKYFLLDYLGVAARGALSESSQPVLNLIRNLDQSKGNATLIGTNIKASPPLAALGNGTAAHSLELDDLANEASVHPGVAVMTAALAAAQAKPCFGKELVVSIVAGYEVAVKLGVALDPAAHYARGFHPTGTCGTLGAAVTAAKILQLQPGGISNSLGIAGSQAAGSMEFLADGSYTKRLHPGWAAHSGIMAALLAQNGFTGPGTIIEGRFGFLHAYSPCPNPDRVLKNWGTPYEVMRTSIKPHACCRYKQGPIDGILKIMRENQLKADDIETVRLGILKAGAPIVAQPEELKANPQSIVDAQFSMPFGAALAILYGRADLNDYSPENIRSAQVKAVMDRVGCFEAPDLDREYPRKWPAAVIIQTKDGREYRTRIEYPKGDPENPLTWEELIAKFENLTEPVFHPEKRKRIINSVRNLDRSETLDSLMSLLEKR